MHIPGTENDFFWMMEDFEELPSENQHDIGNSTMNESMSCILKHGLFSSKRHVKMLVFEGFHICAGIPNPIKI